MISHLSGSTPDGHAHDSTSTSTNTDVGVDVTASPELHQDPTPAIHGQSLEQKRISWTKVGCFEIVLIGSDNLKKNLFR